jgi:hypothetical protein
MDDNQYSTNFENVFLSRRNQNILKTAFVEICVVNGYKLPTLMNSLIINICMNTLEETVHKHKFEAKKLSWINMEVLSRLIKEMEDKKKNNYWEITKLLKLERLDDLKNNLDTNTNNFNSEILASKNFTFESIKPSKKSSPQKISDLFDY